MSIIVPQHLIVGEPELKWCESLIEEHQFRFSCTCCPQRQWMKAILMQFTNMSEVRVNRALNLLFAQKRI